MKKYKTKIGDEEIFVVEQKGMPFMFNTKEKAEDFIKQISYQPERSKREGANILISHPMPEEVKKYL